MRLIQNRRRGETVRGLMKGYTSSLSKLRGRGHRAKNSRKRKIWGSFTKLSERMNHIGFFLDLRLDRLYSPIRLVIDFPHFDKEEKRYILLGLEHIGQSFKHDEKYNIDLQDAKTRARFLASIKQVFGEIDQLHIERGKK